MKPINELIDYDVFHLDVESENPCIIATPRDCPWKGDEKFEIPAPLLYYLKTHWRCTKKVEKIIRSEVKAEIREFLEI